MSEPVDRATIQQMMRRLDEFARVLGLDEATTRAIVEEVVTDMPDALEEPRLNQARLRMISASL